MEAYRKLLNTQQTELRHMMMRFDQHDKSIELFLDQHSRLHSSEMTQTNCWSFEDALLNDMTNAQIRYIPSGCKHSVAWCIWHIARIEDVAMNMLVAGNSQIMHQGKWLELMKLNNCTTGNGMDESTIAKLSATIDVNALKAYRVAVGRKTREIVIQLEPEVLKQKVDPTRLQKVVEEGAVLEAAKGIVDYWGKRNLAGLLLMPATRHNLVHLNKALRLKQRCK